MPHAAPKSEERESRRSAREERTPSKNGVGEKPREDSSSAQLEEERARAALHHGRLITCPCTSVARGTKTRRTSSRSTAIEVPLHTVGRKFCARPSRAPCDDGSM
jgi:hypothetical protein